MKIIISLSLFILFAEISAGQKVEKGSSAKHPWKQRATEETINVDSFIKELEFGQWSFKAAYGYPQTISISSYKEDGPKTKAGAVINSSRYVSNDRMELTSGIIVSFTDPERNNCSMQMDLYDSLSESYFQKVGFPMDESPPGEKKEYEVFHYSREVNGYIKMAAGDSVLFSIKAVFNSSVVKDAYVLYGSDTILVRSLIKPGAIADEVYRGFEFYSQGILIGAATRKIVLSQPVYRYWMNPETKIKTKQILAPIIFVVVGFIK